MTPLCGLDGSPLVKCLRPPRSNALVVLIAIILLSNVLLMGAIVVLSILNLMSTPVSEVGVQIPITLDLQSLREGMQ